MHLQPGVFPIFPGDFSRTVAVWEASVRATHLFVKGADIELFRPLVRDALPRLTLLACVRDADNQVAGFVAVVNRKVEMLFVAPGVRSQGAGKRLLNHAIKEFGATMLDVNEQNGQAVGFYLHMGLEVVGRSELDSTGKPYPLLHMRLSDRGSGDHSTTL